MKIQGSLGIEAQRVYMPQGGRPAEAAQKEDLGRRFDRVDIENNSGRSFELDLRGRLSREVRTATSSGMIADLREQVRSGAYAPDPAQIARKMLLMEEAV